jgi:hypothetical protein
LYTHSSQHQGDFLVGNTNDTASRAGTSIASLLGLLVSTLAEIVSAGVDDDGALLRVSTSSLCMCERGTRTPMTLSEPINLINLSETLPFAFVLKLPKSPTWRSSSSGAPCVLFCGLTVLVLARGPRVIEVWYSVARTVRSGAGAAVGVVAESVDVHAALSVGVVASNVPCDLCGRGLVLLLEGDGTLDVGVSTEDGDWWIVLALDSEGL